MKRLLEVLVVACGFMTACQTLTGELPDPAALDIDDDEGPGTIVLEEQRLTFGLGDDGAPVVVVTDVRQGHIRGERGQWLGTLATGYDTGFEELVDASVRVRFPNGDTKVYGRDKAQDTPEFGYLLYSDNRALVIAPPAVPNGAVVETRAVTRRKQPELFAYRHWFGSSLPALRSRLIVEAPEGWEIETAGELFGEPKDLPPTSREIDGGIVRLTWERADLPRRSSIARGWSGDRQHELVLARLKSWVDGAGVPHQAPADAVALSRLQHGLAEDRDVRSAALAKTVAEVLQGVEDAPAAKASKLYAWTRDNIRYCAVSVGLGGWVPHPSTQTYDLRYGDCKDKANLLRSLLGVAGIPSRAAAIYADDWPRTFRLPVLGLNFNHQILVIDLPDGPVIVDPTSRTTPFGDLPQSDEDRTMLPISAEGSPIMQTPSSSPDKDMLEETYALVLGDDGRASGSFTSTIRGELSDDLREQLLLSPKDRHDDVVQDIIGILEPKVRKFTIKNGAPPETVTPVEITGELGVRLVRGGVGRGDVLLRVSRLFAGAFPSVEEEANDGPRTGPFLLGHRRTVRAQLRLALPASLKVARVPEETRLESKYGSYVTTWSTADHDRTLLLERTVVWKERIVPAADVDAMRAFVATALAADEAPVALVLAEGP